MANENKNSLEILRDSYVGGEGYIQTDFASVTQDNPLPVQLVENKNASVEHFMYEELADVTILSISADGKQVILDTGHGFLPPSGLDADYFNIHYATPGSTSFVDTIFSQHKVVDVAADTIEITPPITFTNIFDIANVESSKRVNVNMAVLGTRAAPIKFTSYPPDGQVWEFRRFIGDMVLDTQPDDALFGDQPSLQYGQYYEFENPFFRSSNLGVFSNGGYRATGYDVAFTTRSGGGGSYGMSFRKTLAGLEKSGVVIQLDGTRDDTFNTYIQDDLTGIVRYRVKVMGDIKA